MIEFSITTFAPLANASAMLKWLLNASPPTHLTHAFGSKASLESFMELFLDDLAHPQCPTESLCRDLVHLPYAWQGTQI